ncbi:MAG: hypothetical protein K2X87_32440 [Gemmataceae bacterium]|nr:hypothetical protein [Gemmataceae bacterium]
MTRRPRPALEALEGRDVPALAGAPDPTFGTGGITPLMTGVTENVVAVDPAGRVILAGQTTGAGGRDFAVTRLLANGSLDPSFGVGGKAVIDFVGGDDGANAVALDTAGRVVVAGTSSAGGLNRFAVARLTDAGTLDPGFGSGGIAVFHVGAGTNDVATGVAVDPADNGVVVGGASKGTGTFQFAAARLTAAGGLDPAFAGGGVTAFTVRPGADDRAFALTLDPARRIILAGSSFVAAPASSVAAFARLTPAGALDPTFAGTGTTTVAGGVNGAFPVNGAFAVDTDGAGNVYAAGSGSAVSTVLVVVKLAADGTPDPTFGIGGVAGLRGAGSGATNSFVGGGVAVAADGKVVVGGQQSGLGGTAVRLTTAGAFDPTFNPTSLIPGETIVPGLIGRASVALAPDGRIVLAGGDTTGSRAVRLLAAATPTPLAVGGSPDGRAVLYTPDGAGRYPDTPTAAVAAFGAIVGANARVAVGDVNADGVPDTVLATGPGTVFRIAVVSGADNSTLLIPPGAPFAGSEGFTGGGFVTAKDLDLDGRAEIIVSPDQGGGPRVTIFTLLPAGPVQRANFFGITGDARFRGGARTAAGDVNRDGVPDLAVAAGFGGGPRVALFNGRTVLGGTPAKLVNDFFAFPGSDAVTLRNGVFLAVGDVTGGGNADLIFGGGPGGAPRVFILDGALVAADNVEGAYAAPVANFFVNGDSADRGGVRVAATDADNDGRLDVAAGSGAGSAARVRLYLGKDFTSAAEPTTFQDVTPFGGAALADGVYVG